ncbi:site-specific integrase [Actinoplanes sp. L3-i22]|uniref:tyrosine-type recombinase/integrase n=1 Tax=Actinoplanes sp. L3-i22 TaxID=2836373 RepID=UPI001C7590FF|nr:site-specific integrase [Actinoplanes sp. L3-i22]BCY10896.1 hypothetical protein L3i22_059840 [Actinoplanes sp. L3-i22]
MASSPEHRGNSVRITWLLGGSRGGAKQSCTFSGPPAARLKLALAAKKLVEARSHDITRDECYEAILGSPAAGPDVVPTFKMWAEQWLEMLHRTKAVEPEVLKQYERYLRMRAMPYFGHRRLPDITREHVLEWVAQLKSARVTYGNKNRRVGNRLLKAWTIRKQFTIFAACLGAASPRWIGVNPAAAGPGDRKRVFGLPPVGPSEGIFLTADEVSLILAKCGPDLRDLIFLGVRTGLRIGELFALDVEHVVFPRTGGATILVRQSLREDGTLGKPKTPASVRDVTVVGPAADLLAARVKGKRPRALLFTSPRGCRWNHRNFRQQCWYKAVAAAQRCPEHPPVVPLTEKGNKRGPNIYEISDCGCEGVLAAHRRPSPHDLRHTHASVLIAQGWHFRKIQGRLGHARFQTTMDIYGHLADLGDDSELLGLEDFFAPESKEVRRPRVVRGSGFRRGRRVRVRHVAGLRVAA